LIGRLTPVGPDVAADEQNAAPSSMAVNHGWWEAARIHGRAFGRSRLVSLLALSTASRRVDAPHAVGALLVIGNRLSMVLWSVAAVVALVSTSLVTLVGLAVSPLAFVAALPVSAACFVAGTAGLRRVQAWWLWRHVGPGLVVSDVAADPRGRGFGGALMDEVVGNADAHDQTLVLNVGSSNRRAVQLYRSRGFTVVGPSEGRSVHMIRIPVGHGGVRVASAPRESSVPAGVIVAGVVAAVVLVAANWGFPAVWLMPVMAAVATAAAWCDLRERRVPNLLTAAGAIGLLALLATVQVVFGVDVVLPAVVGASIWSLPLFGSHVVMHGFPGLGDVKLAGVLGLAAGAVHPYAAFVAAVGSLVLGAAWGLGWRATGRGRTFPFAPPIAAAAVVVLTVWPLIGAPTTW
jgi:leader peptidase (prepilin peptidase)/N-methyltransferase